MSNNIKSQKIKRLSLAVAAASLVSQGVYAQDAQDENRGWAALEEIVVEAERIEARLQDTPVAVTSFGSEQLDELGSSNLRDLQTFAPNVSIADDGLMGRMNPEFNIRGVGAGVPTSSVLTERPVGLYIDGIFLARAQSSVLSIIDAEKIEVLRGPQGTLFGRNATGGAITYKSKKPTEEFGGEVDIRVGDFNLREAQASINIPVSDTLFLRGVYANNYENGYVRKGDIYLGDRKEEAGRLQLRALPTENLTIDVSATYSESSTNGDPRVIIKTEYGADGGLGTGAPSSSRGVWASTETLLVAAGEAPFVENDPRIVRGLYEVPNYCVLNNTNPYDTDSELCQNGIYGDILLLTGEVSWEVNDKLTLISLTGYLETSQEATNNFGYSGAYRRAFNVDSEAFSQELRAVYVDENVNLVAGAIYYNEEGFEDELPTLELSTGFGLGVGRSEAQVLAGETTLRRDEDYSSDATSYGLYGQGTYSFSDALDVTVGMRYSYDKKEAEINYDPLPLDLLGSGRATGNDSWGNFDWRLAVAYNLAEDVMVYASVSEAYKSGVGSDGSLEDLLNARLRGQSTQDPNAGTVAFVPPEEALGYEIGLRSEWFGNRLRANITAYQTDYTDRQQSVFFADPATGNNRFEIQSVGDVEFEGVETELTFGVTENLVVNLNAAVADYEQLGLYAGATLPGVPKKSMSAGANYTLNVSSGVFESSLNYGWQDETWSGFNTPAVEGLAIGGAQRRTPAYGVLSGRIAYTPSHENWTVAVFGKNLLDKEYATSYFGNGFTYGFRDRDVWATSARPRSLGVSLNVKF